jgi:DNA-binding response OmpR family regulator
MRKKILICERDAATRESLKLILGDSRDLILVDSGEQGLEVLTLAPDIGLLLLGSGVTTDSGVDVLRAARELKPGLGVLIITGRGSDPAAPSAGENGALARPFKAAEVLTAVGKIMAAGETTPPSQPH